MSYKSILVCIDGSAESGRLTEVAARLAADFGANLTGLAIVAPLEVPQRLRSPPAKAVLTEEFEKALAAAQERAKSFTARAHAAGVATAAAEVVQAEPLEALAAAGRTADLVVIGQPDSDDQGIFGSHFAERVLIGSIPPVLVVPRKGAAKPVGGKILVAWKNAAGSARALADARPLLARAESVTVLVVDGDGADVSADEALAYLEQCQVRAGVVAVKAGDAGEAILSQARTLGADLVVMGAFGRPRLAEMVLGGATRTVLQDMATCVLMSHSGS